MLTLEKYTFGVGDRFAHSAKAQLQACQLIGEQGVEVIPVWNKSNREHTTIGSEPQSVLASAQKAVKALNWNKPFHVDADHIGLKTVDGFLECSDFFTLDVADFIGKAADENEVQAFVNRHPELVGDMTIPGIERSLSISLDEVLRVARKFLLAVQEAGKIYRYIEERKGAGNFIAEVSMDETDSPQTPPELLIILAALGDEKIHLQTIAPKFTGRFNKGVDYVGNIEQFEREFNDDLAVIAYAVKKYNLPNNLKLSVHSGSDKFSIYTPIRRALKQFDAGLHIKTAGTSWLEEVIGLAEAGGQGLQTAKEIYAKAWEKQDSLCAPYASVIDIDVTKLPSATEVNSWTSEQFVGALRHDQSNPLFNPSLRQLIHVGYKVAAQMGNDYLQMLEANQDVIARNVTHNLYKRHLKPLFLEV